jgi:hypothetical protein
MANSTIAESEILAVLRRPDDFGLDRSHPHFDEMFRTWALGPAIRTRDSSLLEQSNADALEKHLTENHSELASDWLITECRHWAVGEVDHLSFRAVEADGRTPTKIFELIQAWNARLAEYGCADEEDYSRREYEATVENIRDAGRRYLKDQGVPEDWAEQCFTWFWAHDQQAIERGEEDRGGYPSDAELEKCLRALGWWQDEEEEEAD